MKNKVSFLSIKQLAIASAALVLSVVTLSASATPRVVQHAEGQFEITSTPERVVALEYSFVHALAAVGVSPVGVADDQNIEKVIPEVRALIQPWTSVGMRPQPSLETISSLKPDLIIADVARHKAIYKDLSKIAPTLLVKSRKESYQENLDVARKIGVVLNKEVQMEQRIQQHLNTMQEFKKEFTSKPTVQFAVVTNKGMWMHGPASYAGGVISELGLASPVAGEVKAYLPTSFEQFVKVNPEWVLLGAYHDPNVVDDWKKNPLFNMLTSAKKEQVINVSPTLWSLNRGMFAAEKIAHDLKALLN